MCPARSGSAPHGPDTPVGQKQDVTRVQDGDRKAWTSRLEPKSISLGSFWMSPGQSPLSPLGEGAGLPEPPQPDRARLQVPNLAAIQREDKPSIFPWCPGVSQDSRCPAGRMAPANVTLPGPQLIIAQAAAKVSGEQSEYWLKEGLRSAEDYRRRGFTPVQLWVQAEEHLGH